MANGKETTEFSAKVSTEAYDEFKERFPQYGSVTWFIGTALDAFNREVRENPLNKDTVDRAIQRMLDENREVTLTATE